MIVELRVNESVHGNYSVRLDFTWNGRVDFTDSTNIYGLLDRQASVYTSNGHFWVWAASQSDCI